jgi:hypothetical protein
MILKETEDVVNVGKAVFSADSSLGYLFQKTPIMSPKKKNKQTRTVQPGDAFEYTVFKQGFEVVKF